MKRCQSRFRTHDMLSFAASQTRPFPICEAELDRQVRAYDKPHVKVARLRLKRLRACLSLELLDRMRLEPANVRRSPQTLT